MDDREFGTEFRRGLLILLRAVERRYGLQEARPAEGAARQVQRLDGRELPQQSRSHRKEFASTS